MFSHFLRKLASLWRGGASGVRTVRSCGRWWHLAPDAAAVLGPDGPDPDRWLADGVADVVKTGPHRTVYRVTLPAGTVYVKHCRISGFRAWGREVLRPAKARLEFENALALQERGVPAVQPLAWGEPDAAWPGESVLVTRGRDDVIPFVAFLETGLSCEPTATRHRIAATLGRFFARLHDAGVAHPDPHPGNLLVELTPTGGPRFHLIDLHAIRIGRPLSWAESRANLVLFNRWFQLRAGRTDRCRFWHAYRAARRTLSPGPEQARAVERGTAASNLRFWAGRATRCVGKNRYFAPIRLGGIRGHAVRDLPEGVIRDLFTNPDTAFTRPGVRLLKDSRTSTVAEFAVHTPDGPREVILKRVNVRAWSDPLRNGLRPSAVLRSWVNGNTLRDRWLPTPRPLAVVHRYRNGLPAEGYLLAEKVPDAVGLPEAVADLDGLAARDRARTLRTWAGRIARVVRAMHDRAVSHRDLKAPNILLEHAAPDPMAATPMLIDLVGVRAGRAGTDRQRAKELARLNASFLTAPGVTRGDRLRFLRAYLAAGVNRERDWKAWWNAVSRATAAKVAKNRRTGRPLA